MIDPARFWTGENDQRSDRGAPERILHLPEHLSWLLDGTTKILDLGCGCGSVVKHLRSLGKDVAGITYQQWEVNQAHARAIHEVVFGDIHDLPWADATFDGALLWDVIEHTLAPLVVLKEIHRVLTPGGKLLVFVPGQRWGRSWYHIIVPTQPQMRHLLELAGFTQTTCIAYDHEDEGQAVYKVEK